MSASDAISSVLSSRKTWQLTASGITSAVTAAITIYAATRGWSSDRTQDLIVAVGTFVTAVAAASGPFLAALTAAEDIARKLWVTAPPPAEVPPAAVAPVPPPGS